MATKRKRKKAPKKVSAEEFFSSIEPKPEYIKHLIECRCSLAQFRSLDNPPSHKFIVFSELDENADVKPSYAQCNNCGIIHKIVETGQSVTLKKEEMRSLETIGDIKNDLPEWLGNLLEQYKCELHIYQEARFIISRGLWGRFVVLSREREDDLVIGKLCQILGEKLHKIEMFEIDESAV